MKKAKTDKGWAGHKLFGYTYNDRDIRTKEDKYQDVVLENLEKKSKKQKKPRKKSGANEGWVCPKCSTDRSKAVCPRGHTAALTGDCPMIGVAQ